MQYQKRPAQLGSAALTACIAISELGGGYSPITKRSSKNGRHKTLNLTKEISNAMAKNQIKGSDRNVKSGTKTINR